MSLGKENAPLLDSPIMAVSGEPYGRRSIHSKKSLSTNFIKSNETCSPLRASSKLSSLKLCDTITIDTSSEVEFIDNSVQEIQTGKFDWIRTPRSGKGVCSAVKSPLVTQCKNNVNNRPIPTQTPVNKDQFLTGSKRFNVEQWLSENPADKMSTPQYTHSPKRKRRDSTSSLDPEVKDVLVEVYGEDWKKKCKTDVKKKRRVSINKALTEMKISKPAEKFLSTDIISKPNRSTPHETKSGVSSSKRIVRRKIFDDNYTEDLNEVKTMGTASPALQAMPTPSVKDRITKRRRKRSLSAEPLATPSTPATRATPRKTFLASLSLSTPTSTPHPEAQTYKLHFATKKEELCAKLFKLFNSEIFGNALPENMQITWNPKMRGTAGFCYNKRSFRGQSVTRSARIELSTRVVDRADRLRDTLVHEMCHAATWIVDGLLDGHGPTWSSWASRVTNRFPELPRVTRCHNYQVMTKFTYKCSSCGYSINRQSKSIDLNRMRCGLCGGVLELFTNKKRRGKTEAPEFDSTRTIKPPNAFALFVKENYKKLKSSYPEKKHAEIMKLLSEHYAVCKTVITPKAKK